MLSFKLFYFVVVSTESDNAEFYCYLIESGPLYFCNRNYPIFRNRRWFCSSTDADS